MKLISTVAAGFAAFTLAACAGTPVRTAAVESPARAQDIRCRELLVVASNQIQRVCGTEAQWERYERRLAAASQIFVLRLQGSGY